MNSHDKNTRIALGIALVFHYVAHLLLIIIDAVVRLTNYLFPIAMVKIPETIEYILVYYEYALAEPVVQRILIALFGTWLFAISILGSIIVYRSGRSRKFYDIESGYYPAYTIQIKNHVKSQKLKID